MIHGVLRAEKCAAVQRAHAGGLLGQRAGGRWFIAGGVTSAFRPHFPLAQHGKLRESLGHLAGEDVVLKTCYFWIEFPSPLSPPQH